MLTMVKYKVMSRFLPPLLSKPTKGNMRKVLAKLTIKPMAVLLRLSKKDCLLLWPMIF